MASTALKVVNIGSKVLAYSPQGLLANIAIDVGVSLASNFIYDEMKKPKSLKELQQNVDKMKAEYNNDKKLSDTQREKYAEANEILKQINNTKDISEKASLLKKAVQDGLVDLKGMNPKYLNSFTTNGQIKLQQNTTFLKNQSEAFEKQSESSKRKLDKAQVELREALEEKQIHDTLLHVPNNFAKIEESIKNLETKINDKLKSGAGNTNPKGINSDLASKIPEYCKRLESAISKLETDLNAKNGSGAKVDIDMKINDRANTVSSVKNGTDCEGENSQLVYETISTIKDKLTDIYKKIEDYFPKFIMKNDCGSDNLESSTTNAKGAKPSLNKVGFQVKTTGVTDVSSADSQKNNQTSLSQKLFGNWKQTLKASAAQMGDWSTNIKNIVANTAQSLQSTMSTVFLDAFQGKLKSFKDYFKSFASSILQLLSNALANSLVNSSTKVIAGKKADGGTVTNGNTYLVGERGPELFVANTTGTIIPNNKLGLATGTVAPQVTVNVINNSGQSVSARQESRFDGQSYVVDVWLDALNRNVGGLRDVVLAGR